MNRQEQWAAENAGTPTQESLFAPRTGASMARGQSKQDYETPDDFMAAVVRQFGPLDIDLAATEENKKCAAFLSPEKDSLSVSWENYVGNLWLNPPFDHIAPWAKKCLESMDARRNIFLLTPASVGSNWFRDFVYGHALVLALNGRLTFKGTDAPYPKDCMLSVFGMDAGFKIWSWRE